MEVTNSMRLCHCNLKGKLECSNGIHRRSDLTSNTHKRWQTKDLSNRCYEDQRKYSLFLQNLAACVVEWNAYMNRWKECCILGTSSRVCRNLIYFSTQHEGPPVRGPLFDFWAGDGLFFHAKLFQTSFVEWLFCFAQNLQTLVTILIYKNFFGPLGYSASAYVMVGPERYHHLRFGAWIV